MRNARLVVGVNQESATGRRLRAAEQTAVRGKHCTNGMDNKEGRDGTKHPLGEKGHFRQAGPLVHSGAVRKSDKVAASGRLRMLQR
jgi:hypothetical protein